jgi:hypothetical protein
MTAAELQIWDLWYPRAAATGLAFARGRLDAAEIVLVHAPPDTLTVEVRRPAGELLARAADLPQTADRPMARLSRQGDRITRVDLWPEAEDIGRPVILPGGEVGRLLRWWNAEDGTAWRWAIELYNER